MGTTRRYHPDMSTTHAYTSHIDIHALYLCICVYEHDIFGKQRSIVENMDQVGNCSVGNFTIRSRCIGVRNIIVGHELWLFLLGRGCSV
jgi:hypothetical protein